MAQFNAPKNPPWVRAEAYPMQQVGQPTLQQQMMSPQLNPAVVQYQQTPTQAIYSTQLALQQQAISMQQMVANNAQQIYNPQLNSVAAAVARPMNAAFVQPVVAPSPSPQVPAQQQTNQAMASSTATKQRVFTGTVTKVVDSYGFVDEDVFFQMTVVKGPTPIVNDRVLVEAVCLPNMPFKWNATRIQVLPMNEPPRGGSGPKKGFVVSNSSQDSRAGYNAVPPPGEYDEGRHRDRDNRDRRRMRSRERSSQSKRDDEEERRRRRERREKEDKEREEKKDRDRVRSRSPKKQRLPPVVRKYRVRVPEHPLDMGSMSVCDLRGRYRTMYVPSDVFRATPKWQDSFPSQKPLPFSRTAQFHVLSKDVDPIFEYSDTVEPPDADYLFSAKVMLLSIATMEEMMKKCMLLTEDLEKDDGRGVVHPSRLINCLVGTNSRGKNEIMAIGGPWSPSLDGADPATDPNVLIKTAMRSCHALTGVDLTSCSQWFRICEIYYHRAKTTHKGKEIPARVETVVIYVPDVWTVMPSCLEWDGIHLNFKKQLDRKLVEAGKAATTTSGANSEDEKDDGVAAVGKEPTHYAQLDPKTMKVSDLRDELAARTMSPKGLRLQLMARLTKQLKTEQDAEEAEENEKKRLAYIITPQAPSVKEPNKDEDKKKEGDKSKKDVKDKSGLEEKYVLPETPHILVYPSRVAKNGKFSCKLMSLSLLLDYSSDTSKEHTFEVSLFAELFNEMLMRYFGIHVYRALVKVKEETKEEEEKEKKDKEEEKDDAIEAKVEEEMHEKKEEESEDKEKTQVNGKAEKEKETSKEGSDDENSKDSRDRDRRDKKEKDKDKDKEKKKEVGLYTFDKQLLLAFSYFDVSHYGRISATHLEDLVHTLGLHLSRSQVKKLVGKVLQRDHCDYRKLTDLPLDVEAPPPLSHDEEEGEVPVEQLGNRSLVPVFQPQEKKDSPGPTPAKRGRRAAAEKDKESDKLAEGGFVMYKGAQVNVKNLEGQALKNQEMRLATEARLIEQNADMNELKEKVKKLSDSVKSTTKELNMCKSKLSHVKDKLNDQVASTDLYLTALMDIEERLVPILDTDECRRLIRARQAITGAPTINLVPLTKVEDIERSIEEVEDTKPVVKEEVVNTVKSESNISVKLEKHEDEQENMDTSEPQTNPK